MFGIMKSRWVSVSLLAAGLWLGQMGVASAEPTYDAAGRKVSETDAAGQVIRYLYDDADRLIAEISPSGERKLYRYGADGQRIEATASTGQGVSVASHGSADQ